MNFHNFPAPGPDSLTFQAWKIWTLNSAILFRLFVYTLQQCGGIKKVGQAESCNFPTNTANFRQNFNRQLKNFR